MFKNSSVNSRSGNCMSKYKKDTAVLTSSEQLSNIPETGNLQNSINTTN